jgi:hypothetical protein
LRNPKFTSNIEYLTSDIAAPAASSSLLLSASGIHQRAEIRSDQKKGKIQKRRVIGVAAIIEGKIMNLSVEAKVAIAVATSLVLLIVGAMAQG